MNKKQFIARLASDLKQFDESNLIDYRVIREEVDSQLKRFGNNLMVGADKVIKVVDGKAKLPDNFWKLDLAVKCEPEGYTVESGSRDAVISSFSYKEITEEELEWDNYLGEYLETDYKKITEVVKVSSSAISLHFNRPQILRLTKGISRESCSSTCKNLQDMFTHSSPWEISIRNKTIYTNFNDGYIYVQYSGLEVDEEGEIIIPETQHGHLYNYLMFHCKATIMLNLMANGDEPNLINMYQIFSAKEADYFSLAMTEVKMESLGHDWDKKMKNKMRRTTLMYENMFPR